MSSTRNKNAMGNYQTEQTEIAKQYEHRFYENGAGAKAHTMNLAGNGLLTGRYAPELLSQNYCEIESFLYGIGSSNLVNPKSPVVGELYDIASLNVAYKPPMIIDAPFVQETGQRPLFR